MSLYEETPEGAGAHYMAAAFRLGMIAEIHPRLLRDEREARLRLASAILAMDAAEGIEGRHNLVEQADVNAALNAYGQALADLLRGES